MYLLVNIFNVKTNIAMDTETYVLVTISLSVMGTCDCFVCC